MANKDKDSTTVPDLAAVPLPATTEVIPVTEFSRSPRLGDTIKVLGNADAPPRIDANDFFPTDKAIEVVVTTRIVKLLRDGDLHLI